MTAKVMDSMICSIMLLDEKREELVIVATQSLSLDYTQQAEPQSGTIGERQSGLRKEAYYRSRCHKGSWASWSGNCQKGGDCNLALRAHDDQGQGHRGDQQLHEEHA